MFCFACIDALCSGLPSNNPFPLKPTDDLELIASEYNQVDALAHFAWGSYLALNEIVDNNDVVNEYIQSIKSNPNSDFLIRELLYLWADNGILHQNENILKHLSEIARKNPKSVNLNLLVASAYNYRKEYDLAEDYLNEVFKEVKWSEPLIIKELSYCYLQSNQFKKLHKLLRNALSDKRLKGNFTAEYCAAISYSTLAASDNSSISMRKRVKFSRLGVLHAINAAKSFDPAESFENSNEIMVLVGLLLRQNLILPAIKLLKALRNGGWETAESTTMLAECYENINEFNNALTLWKELSKADPFNSFYHVRMGRNLKKLEQPKDALLAYKTGFYLNANPQIAFEISALYYQLNQQNEALYYAKRAPPHIPETYILQSYIFRQMNQYEYALKALQHVPNSIKDKSDEYLTVDYYLTLATMYYALNKKEEIEPTLEKAIKLDPENSEVNNFLGYYLAEEKKDLNKAEKLIRLAIAKDPENAAYLDSLAWVLFRKGKNKKAAINILRAIAFQKGKKDGIIFEHAGDIYLSLGDPNKALAYWQEALNHNIESPEKIKEKIESLKK